MIVNLNNEEIILISNLVKNYFKETKKSIKNSDLENDEFAKSFSEAAFKMMENLLKKLILKKSN